MTIDSKSFRPELSAALAAVPTLSQQQMAYLEGILQGKSSPDAAEAAGYNRNSASIVHRSATMQAALFTVCDRFFRGELLPITIGVAKRMIEDDKTAAGARAALIQGVWDRAGLTAKRHEHANQAERDPSTMSMHELQSEIDKLQRTIAEKETTLRDITPVDTPTDSQDIDIFR